MRRLVLHLAVLHVVAALLAVGASPARSHWDQPHQIIGGLTRIIDLPEPHRTNFYNCRKRGFIHDGLTRPDVRRDSAFIITRLGYMVQHQRSADNSQNAYQAAAHRYADAVKNNDEKAACEAILQLSESIHYLQDAADATKMLEDCRQRISRLVSSYVVKKLSGDKDLMNALRESHDRAGPTIATLPIMPLKKAKNTSALANHLLAQREGYVERLNGIFDNCKPKNGDWRSVCRKLENLSGRDDELVGILDQELPQNCKEELVRVMTDIFGLMWAAQDRYAVQFVRGKWYLISGSVLYRYGTNPEMRCVKTIKRVVETGVSDEEREQALEQVRQEIKKLVTTDQVHHVSDPLVRIIKISDKKIDQPLDSDPKPKCTPGPVRALTNPLSTTPSHLCREVCLQWTLGEKWEASDGRNIECCPYPAEKNCIDVTCKKEYECTIKSTQCSGGLPQPPPQVCPPYSSGSPPGGGVHLGQTDPGVSAPQQTYIPPPSPAYLQPQVQPPPPHPVYIQPQIQPQTPPIRQQQTYVRPPQVQSQTQQQLQPQTQPQTPPIRQQQTDVRPPQVQSQMQQQLQPQTQPPSTSVYGYTTRPPQQGATTRPPEQGVSMGMTGTRTDQVSKPPCRCIRQERYWWASDGRHKTCCPNPQQKRCIATKCEQRTKCLEWGPPGCVRYVR